MREVEWEWPDIGSLDNCLLNRNGRAAFCGLLSPGMGENEFKVRCGSCCRNSTAVCRDLDREDYLIDEDKHVLILQTVPPMRPVFSRSLSVFLWGRGTSVLREPR